MIGVEPLPTGVACLSPDPPGVPRAGVLGAAGLLLSAGTAVVPAAAGEATVPPPGLVPASRARPLLGYEASTFIDLLEDEEVDAVKRAIMHEAR